MTVSVKEICEVLFDLEEKYDLNYQEIQGCFAWQMMRFSVYLELTKKLGIFGAVQQRQLSLFDKVKSFIPFLKNSLLFNPLSGNYTKDIRTPRTPRRTSKPKILRRYRASPKSLLLRLRCILRLTSSLNKRTTTEQTAR